MKIPEEIINDLKSKHGIVYLLASEELNKSCIIRDMKPGDYFACKNAIISDNKLAVCEIVIKRIYLYGDDPLSNENTDFFYSILEKILSIVQKGVIKFKNFRQ